MSVSQPSFNTPPEQLNKKIGTMQKNLCLILLAVFWTVETAPVSLDSLEYDKLDTNLDDLKYEIEEDLDELIDEADKPGSNHKADTNTNGHRKNTASSKVSKRRHNIGDLKKFFNTAGVQDRGNYDDDDFYAKGDGYFGTAVGVKGNEDRKYRKGTKTRGFHRVHHKDEYKKDKVFYEDDERSGAINKVGVKGLGYKIKAGAGFNKGHFHHDRQKGIFNKRGYSDSGLSDKKFSDYADSQGFDESLSNEK